MASSCSHPPVGETSQLLVCRQCHAVKVEGVLVHGGASYALKGEGPSVFTVPLAMIVDPALVGKRVRVIIEEVLPEEEQPKMS